MSNDNSIRNTAGDRQDIGFGPDEITEILRSFEESAWTGLHLTVGGVTVSAGKDAPPPATGRAPASVPSEPVTAPAPTASAPPSAAAAPTAASAPVRPEADTAIDEGGLVAITAPTVGSFWVAPDPGSPPFVEVGSRVEAGDQLAIVEVMKLMSPVVSDVAGVVAAIRARNADMVEFGQPLFLIRPDD
ncbi:acetyl-CoA carboxylase biotin carboxyl carrier protein [Gordonia sp. NPDC058843]|uniref:acetyl-CoA carboxylase biotin carboxyl carrier protein n=1 Tax=Gordonia sp. NPDC058843 TaxID=3346648 RepID=UPI0036C1081E